MMTAKKRCGMQGAGYMTRAGGATAVLLITLALFAGTARAGTLYWDGGNTGDANSSLTGVGLGGSATWDDQVSSNWWSGSGADTVWVNSNNDTAVFWGTNAAPTVTLGSGITCGGLTFNTTGYTLDAGANTLTFGAATNALTLNNVAAATIGNTLSGSGNVTLSGGAFGGYAVGSLVLTGVSAGGWSGTTTIGNGMTMSLTNANQALLNTTGITLNSGGALTLIADATTLTLDRVNDSATITVNGGGKITYTTVNDANTYAETLGPVSLVSGFATIDESINHANATGSQTLTLGGLSHAGSSCVYFNESANTGINTTKNIMKVAGAAQTPAGQIIGPWAVVNPGNTLYFAIYDASNRITRHGVTAGTDDATWTDPAQAYVVTNNEALSATRTVMGLRHGGLATVDLGNFNLETHGWLHGANGGNSTLQATGTGALTTPAGGGNLYLTIGWSVDTISAPIIDNGGAVTVVASVLTASSGLTLSGTNTFSGGLVINGPGIGAVTISSTGHSGNTVINGGKLTITSDSNLGTNGNVTFNGSATLTCGGVSFGSGRAFTLNNGALATLSGGAADITIPGLITGTGGFVKPNTGFGFILSNPSNDFSGPLYVLNSNNNSNQAVKVAGIGDTPGVGVITIGDPGNSGAISWFSWTGGAKTFNNRQFGFSSGNARLYNDGTGALTINTDLFSIWPTVNGTLNVGGSYFGAGNTIAGRIGDPGPGKTNSLTKAADSSIWVLSGSNTYSGATTISGGVLCFANKAAKAIATATATAGSVGLGVGGAGYYTATDLDSLYTNGLIGFSLAAASGVAIDTTAGDFIYVSSITNSRALTKLGANTLTLTGSNTYAKATTVVAGTLLVDGTHTGALGYTVMAGGALGGTGSIICASNSNVTLNGTLTPGSAGVGTLGVTVSGTGKAVLGTGAVLAIQAAGAQADKLVVTGTLDLPAAATVNVTGIVGGAGAVILSATTLTGATSLSGWTVSKGYKVQIVDQTVVLMPGAPAPTMMSIW